MAVYEIGTQCESMTNALIGSVPKPLTNAIVTSSGLDRLLYDTQSGSFLLVPHTSFTLKVGELQNISTRTYNSTTGQYTSTTRVYVRNKYCMNGFRFNFAFQPGNNINRRERTGIVNITEVGAARTSRTVELSTITAASGTVTIGGSSVVVSTITQDTSGTPPADIANGLSFEVYNVDDTGTYSLNTVAYNQYSMTLGTGAAGSEFASNYLAISSLPNNTLTITESFSSSLAGGSVTNSTRLSLKPVGISAPTGQNYYVNCTAAGVISLVDLNAADIGPNDITQYQIKEGSETLGNQIFKGLGLALFGQSSTIANLGFVIFTQSLNTDAYVNVNIPSIGVTRCNIVLATSATEVGLGRDIILFRYGVTCPSNTANTFLKLDQSVFNSGLQPVITTGLFTLQDYFMDNDPIRSFQYIWYDKGRLSSEVANTRLSNVLSNVFDWGLNLVGVSASAGAYRVVSTTAPNTITLIGTAGLVVGAPVQINQTLGGITAGTTYYIKTIPNSTTMTLTTNKNYVAGTLFVVITATPAASPAVHFTVQSIPNPSNVYVDITTLAAPKITLAIDGSGLGTPVTAGWMLYKSPDTNSSNVAIVYYAGNSGGNNQYFYLNPPALTGCPNFTGNIPVTAGSGSLVAYTPTVFQVTGPVTSLTSPSPIPLSAFTLRCVRCSQGRYGSSDSGVCTDAFSAVSISVAAPLG